MADFAFHHGGASVPSLDQAIEWQGRVLGFEVKETFGKGCFIRDCAANLIEFVEGPNA